jgi:hypothetical protein
MDLRRTDHNDWYPSGYMKEDRADRRLAGNTKILPFDAAKRVAGSGRSG